MYTGKICSLIMLSQNYMLHLLEDSFALIWKILECLFCPITHSWEQHSLFWLPLWFLRSHFKTSNINVSTLCHTFGFSFSLSLSLSLSLCVREHGERHRACARSRTQSLIMMLVFCLIFIFKICFHLLLQVSYTCRWIICNKPWLFLVNWCIWSWAPGVGRRKLWVVFQGMKVLTDILYSSEVDSIGRKTFCM